MSDSSQNELIVILLTLTRIVLGIVFLFSATGKIRNPNYFVRAVSNYHILHLILTYTPPKHKYEMFMYTAYSFNDFVD